MLSLASSWSLRQPRVDSVEGLGLVALNDCFSNNLYRRLGIHLLEEVARNHGPPDYSVSYPLKKASDSKWPDRSESLARIVLFGPAYKVYVDFSARRFTCDLKEAYTSGQVGNTPHFNSVNRYIANPDLTDPLNSLVSASSFPLQAVETDFAVDSSGFSTSRFVRWFNRKYGRETDNR